MKVCLSDDSVARARFEQEVALLRALKHPGVVPILEAELSWHVEPKTGLAHSFYVTERYDSTLADLHWLRRAPIYAVRLFLDLCDAMEYVHSQDPPIVHRDLKPTNILLGSEPWRLAVADFGVARPVDDDLPSLTRTHEVVGTKNYRAPETFVGADATICSDVYSLGRILEWILTGQEPNELNPRPIPVGEHFTEHARIALQEVVQTACAMDPARRFASVSELRKALPVLRVATLTELNERTVVETQDQVKSATSESPTQTQAEGPLAAYEETKYLLRSRSTLRWREIMKTGRKDLHLSLLDWRAAHEGKHPTDYSVLHHWMDDALNSVGTILARALAVIEFPTEGFGDGLFLLNDLADIVGWNGSGLTVLVEFPGSLIYVSHNLFGATAISAGHWQAALAVARHGVRDRRGDAKELWQVGKYVGWPEGLGGHATESWNYLKMLPERHPWISTLFGDPYDYKVALNGYWWLLTFVEFAQTLEAKSIDQVLATQGIRLDVPPLMLLEDSAIVRRGFKSAFDSAKTVRGISAQLNVNPQEVYARWDAWGQLVKNFAAKFGGNGRPWIFADELVFPQLPQ